MTDTLIVNPFLTLRFGHEGVGNIFLTAPKPSEGLRALELSQSEHKNLYEVFTDLSQTGFNFLDAEKDLSENERELLWRHGILLERENAPEKPFFACQLTDVEAQESHFDPDSLFVNSSFRFEPLNLSNFSSWVHEKHLSPYQPSAWIRSPVTDLEVGYWLSADEADIVSKFIPGKKPQDLDDHKLVEKLVGAEILIAPENLIKKVQIWKGRVSAAQKKFAVDKYATVSGILPNAQMTAMRRFYRQYVKQGFMPLGDAQVSKRFHQGNEPLASLLHKKLVDLVGAIVGEEVKPSYVYAASYKGGADLKPHLDREQCEFSISFQVDYQPEQPDQMSPWALYVEPLADQANSQGGGEFTPEWKYPEPNPDEQTAVYLASGDGLMYKGCELLHYRNALPAGHTSTSLFFHYVGIDFAGNLD